MISCTSKKSPVSGQVRFLKGRTPTPADVKAGIALLSNKTSKAQDILDCQVMEDRSTARSAAYLCAQQGYPALAQRYNRMAFRNSEPGDLEAFVVSLDAYCLGMYGLIFDQFREHLAVGGSLAKVMNQSAPKACFDEIHLIGAAGDFNSVYEQDPKLALSYIDLLVRHPLGIVNLAALASTVMPALRKRLTTALSSQALEEARRLSEAIAALKARHIEVTAQGLNPVVKDPAWFDGLQKQCELLNS